MSHNFKYRFVGFGTNFEKIEGLRNESTKSAKPGQLFENELAVDVGGVCWGHKGEERSILDHHFHRDDGGQIPSATASVLHNAHRIFDKFKGFNNQTIWLVTHANTDFDAFCALYIARKIIEEKIPAERWTEFGLHPDGWFDVGDKKKFDWYMPPLNLFSGEIDRRWAVLLASYASYIDNCRRLYCSKNRALHSILYAAMRRGRNYTNETSGALEFFDEIVKAMVDKQLNPLFDSVLEGNLVFSPELNMLDREIEAYQRDITRARRSIVNIQESTVEFKDWYSVVQKQPLLSSATSLNQKDVQVDGIYMRDPESLLFKEWARNDNDSSSMGRGFLFTAVAYSSGRSEGNVNKTDYFFALDPENAGRKHLYKIWLRLQSEEIKAFYRGSNEFIKRRVEEENKSPRQGFEERSKGYERYFNDPWFDGSNYKCTIIATPKEGTIIGKEGIKSDLSDDLVAQMIQEELEFSVYDSNVYTLDFRASEGNKDIIEQSCGIAAIKGLYPAGGEYFRFGKIRLRKEVDISNMQMAQQIGHVLWQILNPGKSMPPHYISQNLVIDNHWVAVWSRQGVVIAYMAEREAIVLDYEDSFRKIALLSCDLDKLMNMKQTEAGGETIIEESKTVRDELVRLMRTLALPGNYLPGLFFETTKLGHLLETVSNINITEVEKEQGKKTDELKKNTEALKDKIEQIAFIFLPITVLLSYFGTVDVNIKKSWWLVALASLVSGCIGYLFFRFIIRPGEGDSPKR